MVVNISDFLARRRRPGRVVSSTLEFRRIYDLPRRLPDPASLVGAVSHADLWTHALALPNGTMRLNDAQGWAFSEAYTTRGLLADYPVGTGKSLVSFLLPTVLEVQRPLVVMPANALAKKTLKIDFPECQKHFLTHPNIKFISYEKLSRQGQDDFLTRNLFDLIVCDEVHKLKDHKSAAFRRIQRYKEENPSAIFCGMSGTSTSKSLREYAHILELALGDGSPLPVRFMDLELWADALDEGIEDEYRPAPGALLQFCAAGENARQGFQRRLRETPGYVSVLTSNVERCSLFVEEDRSLVIPQVIVDALENMRLNQTTPSLVEGEQGDFIASAIEFGEHVEELMNGFFYRWIWPGNVKDFAWINARRAWKRYVRWVISTSPTGRVFDTEEQVAMAVDAGQLPPCPDPEVAPPDVRAKWLAERERFSGVLRDAFAGVTWAPEEYVYWTSKREPPRQAIWLSDHMVDHVQRWIQQNDRGLAWVGMRALQDRLRQRGVLVYGGGQDEVVYEKNSCAVSIHAHREAKNLQHFNKNLFVAVPASGQWWEQALGRTHRFGQRADEVTAEILLPCREFWDAFSQARRDAKYVFETKGQAQKLHYADVDVSSELDVDMRAAKWPRDPLWCTDYSRVQPAIPPVDGNNRALNKAG